MGGLNLSTNWVKFSTFKEGMRTEGGKKMRGDVRDSPGIIKSTGNVKSVEEERQEDAYEGHMTKPYLPRSPQTYKRRNQWFEFLSEGMRGRDRRGLRDSGHNNYLYKLDFITLKSSSTFWCSILTASNLSVIHYYRSSMKKY